MIGALRLRLGVWAEGFGALGRLVPQGWRAWRAGTLPALLGHPDSFAVLRAFLPNVVTRRRLVTGFDNTGTALVTRHADVIEVLEREADFAVVYEPRMRAITAGENFFLGMQDSPAYTRDVSAMRLAIRREDVAQRLLPIVAAEAAAIVGAADTRLDLAGALTRRVPARLALRYFGLPEADEDRLIAWTTAMFWHLFLDLQDEAPVREAALDAAAECRAWLDAAIAARKATPSAADDVLGRCLALQDAGVPGMDDLGIRNNLIGVLIGLVPTLSKATVLTLQSLLERPEALAQAEAAARADDDAALAAIALEAFRLRPMNALIYRRANRDVVLARATRRAARIPAGTLVMAFNQSAMLDPLALDAPRDFRPGRPAHHYILWGHGMHRCFGAHINQMVIPQMLKPLLRRGGLQAEAPPEEGGTPFPQHYMIRLAPASA